MIDFKPKSNKFKVNYKFNRTFIVSKGSGRRIEPPLTDKEIEEVRKKFDIKVADKNPHGYSNGL